MNNPVTVALFNVTVMACVIGAICWLAYAMSDVSSGVARAYWSGSVFMSAAYEIVDLNKKWEARK